MNLSISTVQDSSVQGVSVACLPLSFLSLYICVSLSLKVGSGSGFSWNFGAGSGYFLEVGSVSGFFLKVGSVSGFSGRSDPGFYTYFHFDSTAPRREEIEKLFCIKYS